MTDFGLPKFGIGLSRWIKTPIDTETLRAQIAEKIEAHVAEALAASDYDPFDIRVEDMGQGQMKVTVKVKESDEDAAFARKLEEILAEWAAQ